MDETLDEAPREHRGGRLEGAIRIYDAVLERRPDHPEALHLRGVAAHQRGEHARAADLIGRAIAAAPGVAAYHCNLAEALRALGRLGEASAACGVALALRPDYPEARNNLGAALFLMGRPGEAEGEFREAIRLRPDDALSHSNLADALRQRGKIGSARDAYEAALRIDPDLTRAHRNLGPLLLLAGEVDPALEHCRRAVELDPSSAEAHGHLGLCLRALGRLDDAMDSFERAFELDPGSPAVCNQIGEAWQESADLDQARSWFARALGLDPDSARTHCNLGAMALERQDNGAALGLYRKALELEPACAEAHAGLASALWEEGDAAGAIAGYREAVRLRPELASLLASLGHVYSSTGELSRAEGCFREAIARNPRCVPAYSGLATDLRGRFPDADLAGMEALLELPWLAANRRASLHFGLAHAHDGRGDSRRAAAHMIAANRLQKEYWEERGRGYDPARHTLGVDALIAAFTPELLARAAGSGTDSERPVFIVGMPRSGTTLTEQVIASHPRGHGAGERHFASDAFRLLPRASGRDADADTDPLDCLAGANPDAFDRLARWHLDRLHRLDAGNAARVVDKMPDNYALVGFLHILFPRARFFHCRRDVRDVALSCWITNFSHLEWAVDPGHIAHRIHEYLRLMDHWRRVLPGLLHEVDYEQMVADQEGVSRRLIDRLGLDWDPACLDFHKTERLVRTASVSQVRRPIYRHAVARWRRYEDLLAPLFDRLPLAAGE